MSPLFNNKVNANYVKTLFHLVVVVVLYLVAYYAMKLPKFVTDILRRILQYNKLLCKKTCSGLIGTSQYHERPQKNH